MGAWESGASGEGDDAASAGQSLEELSAGVAPSGLREGIAASWRRSLAHGVPRDVLTAPYDERALDPDSLLVRAADPVLAQLRSDMAGSPVALGLTDDRGRILRRVTADPGFDNALDDIYIAPGFSYAERYVGTNALGTALHERAVVAVRAREHFNDRLTGLSCFAAPVRDPLTGRVLGAVGIGVAATPDGAPYTAVARQAATLIENRHFDLRAEGQRELYGTYLAALHHGRDQVFVLAADVLRAPPSVMHHLGGVPHEQLWALAVDALSHRSEAQAAFTLPCGAVVEVRLRAVEHHGRLVGALGEVRPPETSRSTPPPAAPVLPPREYAGWSAPTRSAAVALRRLAEERHPGCVVGEVGTGKATMVEVIAARVFPGRPLLDLDRSEATDGELLDRVSGHLAEGHPVLLRHVEGLGTERLAELLERTRQVPGRAGRRGWLAMTWRSDPGVPGAVLRTPALRMLTLPPLRSRPDDVPKALDRMLKSHPEGARVTFTRALVEQLRREPWPTNLAGLHEVVEELLVRRTGAVVDVADLGEVLQATVRRRMTPVEWMLRAAIVDALRTHGGNKDLAAESLGMSRASIYRKIKSLDIDVEAVIRD